MKNIISKLTKILSITLIAAALISLFSCGGDNSDPTSSMSEEDRYEYLLDESQKFFDPYRYHDEYEIAITYTLDNEVTTYNIAYHEYYDESDPSNVKFMKTDSVNDLDGVVEQITYVDGVLYRSTDERNYRGEMASFDDVSPHLYGYHIAYGGSVLVRYHCPPIEDGKYTVTQTAVEPKKEIALYRYLSWLIPEDKIDVFQLENYMEDLVYDSEGRLLEIRYFIDICDPNINSNDKIYVKYKNTIHYDDFEITAPEDGENYHYLNDISAAYDAIYASHTFIGEQSGSFDTSFDISLSGEIETSCSESNSVSYSLADDGSVRFTVESTFSGTDVMASKSVTSYDGASLITESQGSRTHTPTSVEDAYYFLLSYKDLLNLYDGSFGQITDKSENSVSFTLKGEFFASILKNELYYFFELEPDEGSIAGSSACTLRTVSTEYGKVADEIVLTGNATFKVNGMTVNMTYEYNLKVASHQN